MAKEYALYQLSIKALVKNDDKILVLKTPDGWYDFPGGRVDATEYNLDFMAILERELLEELGQQATFKITDLVFATRREYTINGQVNLVVALFYLAQFTGGDIALSDEHSNYEWLDSANLMASPEKFMSSDEHEQFQKYFAK